MKTLLALVLLLVTAPVFAQTAPYVFGGVGIQNGGYQNFSPVVGAGFESDTKHLVFNTEGTYNGAHKVNDGTGQDSGYTLRGTGSTYGRVGSFLLGGGAAWSETHTDLYAKQVWHPFVGGGYDFKGARLITDYLLPGTDKYNGAHGPRFSLLIPKPTEGRHFFLRWTLALYMFHDTITDFNSPALVKIESSHHNWSGGSEFTIGWRF